MQNVILTEAAIIVSYSASQWTGRKLDKEVTEKTNKDQEAAKDGGRFNKLLIAKHFTEDIQALVSKARLFHYNNTLVWSDNNERLLPAKNYFPYITEMNSLKAEFEQAVKDFLNQYDHAVNESRIRLGKMFKIEEFPTKAELESKYSFAFTFMPVPSNNIEIKLNDSEVEKIRQEVEREINNRLANAVKGIWERVADVLQKMRDKLADSEGKFRDSLFGNMWELVELIPSLNVTNDIEIAKIVERMKELKATPDMVRSNGVVRAETAQKVDNILKDFEGMFKA